MFLAKVTIFIKVLKSLFVGIVYTNSYLLYIIIFIIIIIVSYAYQLNAIKNYLLLG
jgi:hypothetical protein